MAQYKIDPGWIPIKEGCRLPYPGEEVQVTIWIDESRGRGSRIVYAVDNAIFSYTGVGRTIGASAGRYSFVTMSEWDEGWPVRVIAWRPKPLPMLAEKEDQKKWIAEWKAGRRRRRC